MQGIGYTGAGPLECGAAKIIAQDQTTPPFVGYLLQSGTAFTLASPTQKSTITELYYSATLVAGHGVIVGDDILIADTISGQSIYATVMTVATNDITIDRPWDHDFPATSFCRKVSRSINVDGSTTPEIFAVQVGSVPADIYGVNVVMYSSAAPDDGKFGGIAALTNGVCFRVYDGYDKVIGNAKTNGELRSFGSTVNPYSDKGPAGTYGTNIYIPIRDQWGVPIRLSETSQLQIIIQDDLEDLTDAYVSFVGQYTQGETVNGQGL